MDGQEIPGIRPFTIHPNTIVTMHAITVTRGFEMAGAGIYNRGTLTLNYSAVSANHAGVENGGGIHNEGGTITLNNSTIDHNQSAAGGGIYNRGGGVVSLVNSTVSSNSADGAGGGVHNHGGTVVYIHTTISDNAAAGIGGGVYSDAADSSMALTNSIIANNSGGDCTRDAGTIHADHSLFESGLGCVNGTNSGNLTGDPNLGPLQNNGGPTLTHALLDPSPAVDGGNNDGALDAQGVPLITDQRGSGFFRYLGNAVDMGAYEFFICAPFPRTVASSMYLDYAIACFNAQSEAGEYLITLSDDITLDASTTTIDNPNPAITLRIMGNDHTVDGQDIAGVRPFTIHPNTIVALEAITITRGNVTTNADGGGGILNLGTLTLTNGVITDNTAGTHQGGGIRNVQGVVTLVDSTVDGNYSRNGGGIRNHQGEMTLLNSTISNNTAERLGGGIYNETGNSGMMVVINSTVSANRVLLDSGSGIINNGSLTLINSTITDSRGGAIGGLRTINGTTTLTNTIVANSTGPNCGRTGSGTVHASYSLIEGDLGCVNGTNNNNLTGDPNLGPLQDNGGPTFTHALRYGSPAMDGGSNDGALDAQGQPLATDQRGTGFPRIRRDTVDIGAFEYIDELAPTANPVQEPAANGSGWNNGDVTVTWNWIDNTEGSGLDPANCTLTSVSSGAGDLQLSATCADLAGNVGNASYTVKVDTTLPTATPLQEPLANANNWNSTPVTVSWNWSDGADGSGLDPANCTTNTTSSGEGEIELAATCTDLAGNQGSGTYTVRVDTTPPTATPIQEPLANANNWNSTPVTVAWNWTDDAGSGIDPANCTTTSTAVDEGEIELAATCSDLAGNQGTAGYTVQVDMSPLTADPAQEPLPNVNGWNNADVTVTWNWAEGAGGSGLDIDNCTTATPSSDEGEIELAATCADLAANQSSATYMIRVDKTVPTATLIYEASANGSGWYTSPVTITWAWADNTGGSGIDLANCSTAGTASREGESELTATCRDLAGNAGNASYTVKIDMTPPTASPTQEPATDANRADVVIAWNWSDGAGSGIDPARCTLTSTSSEEGEIEFAATCTDLAGNQGSATYTVGVDTTPPAASPVQEPLANGHNWNSTPVTVAWNWTDGADGSGLDPANCTLLSTSSEEGEIELSATCTDLAGNQGSGTYTVRVDMTRPTIRAVAMSEPNDAGWYNSDVSVQFTCADALSGLAADACPAHQLLDSEGETVISTAQTITDAAGNISDSSNVVTVKLDKTPPTLNPVVSPDPLFVGDSAAISTGAADLLSGVAHASCDALDTRTAGVKSVTCVAGDDAGNRASVTVEVLVDEADEDTPTETEQSNRVFLPGVMR